MTINAYAKINLTLEVFGLRTDGYHALRSVIAPISLFDTIEIEKADGVTCNLGYDDDLCVKAAKVLGKGAKINVEKRIPIGGGLGGGSADAAAVLLALNSLYEMNLTIEELAEIGAQIGSDVPSLVLAHDGHYVLMEGRGEKVSRVGVMKPLDFVLVNPEVTISTREVYSRYVGRNADSENRSLMMVEALKDGDLATISKVFANDLQASAIALCPAIADVITSLRSAGAEGVAMSGSGSTVFGLVPSEARGREIAALMTQKGLWADTFRTIVP